MMDCKKALQETDGDMDKAVDYLRKKGLAKAEKRAGRATAQGLVYSYIHTGGTVGVMLELNCETDFVAKTEEFKQLAHDIALHIAAMNPVALDRESVPAEVVEREKKVYMEQAAESGKPANIQEKMAEGKLNKFFEEACLLEQKFVKDPDVTIGQMITNAISKTGENTSLRRFVRYALGDEG